MANDLWTTVEDAVLAALKAELDSQVGTLAAYQGDWLTDLQPGVLALSGGFSAVAPEPGGAGDPGVL